MQTMTSEEVRDMARRAVEDLLNREPGDEPSWVGGLTRIRITGPSMVSAPPLRRPWYLRMFDWVTRPFRR